MRISVKHQVALSEQEEQNEKSIAKLQGTSARCTAEMVTTAIDSEKPVSDDHHRDPAKRRWPPR